MYVELVIVWTGSDIGWYARNQMGLGWAVGGVGGCGR